MNDLVADRCIVNGKVVNVYTGEIIEQLVGIRGERIIYVGGARKCIGSETQILDACGDYVIPGFFDAHAHADLYCNPIAYAGCVAARGTTGFFNDGHDLANALGPAHYLEFMSALQDTPFSVLTGVPATSPPYPGIEGGELWSDKDILKAASLDWVVSLSEISPYPRILRGDDALMKRIALARKAGMLAEGHTTGANEDKLNALAAAGITSCHESLSSRDVMERMRLGYYVMLRQGSIRRDLPNLVDAVKQLEKFDTSRTMLVTDGIFPDHLISWGNMDWAVKSAVENGIAPIRAIQMATINPARYFGLDATMGSIAPGRAANILLVRSLENPFPRLVMAKGTLVAEDGDLKLQEFPMPQANLGGRPFKRDNILRQRFKISSRGLSARVPAIGIVNQTVTERIDVDVPSQQGFYEPGGDVLAAFLVTRDGSRMGRGFIKGFCPGLGGLASSISHETHGLLVLGQKEEDMRLAANEVLAMKGGIVISQGGRILSRLDLPIGGVCSARPVSQLAGEIIQMHSLLRQMGCSLEYPLWTLGFLSFTSVLGPRITYSGTYDVRSGNIIFPDTSRNRRPDLV